MHRLQYCVLLFCFGASSFAFNDVSQIEPFIFEDMINETIEAIRPDIPDPLKIDALNVTLPDDLEILTGSADLSNFELTGLQGFQVTFLNFDLGSMTLNFTFNFPSINLNTNYWLDMLAAELIPLYGEGKVNVHIVNLEIQGSGGANLTGGISIKNLRIQLYVESATFNVQGALNDEDFSAILSQLLNDLVASFIDNHQEVISNVLSPLLQEIINIILAGTDVTTTTTEGTTNTGTTEPPTTEPPTTEPPTTGVPTTEGPTTGAPTDTTTGVY